MDRNELLACANAFPAQFCRVEEGPGWAWYRDDAIPDMYDHNFLLLSRAFAPAEVADLVADEMEWCRAEGKSFCQVRSDVPLTDAHLAALPAGAEVSQYGFYAADDFSRLRWGRVGNCNVRRADSAAMINERAVLETEAYGKSYGDDFCRRKNARNAAVYLAPGGADTYLAYAGGVAVGKADFFLHGATAQIEDFDVLPGHQRKGYGTAILQHLAGVAAQSGAKQLLLVTDLADTAKDMYAKLGFLPCPGQTNLFYSGL